MDGNGRWAKERGLSRFEGHRQGRNVAIDMLEYCGELGIEQLTLYAFSQENWKRPKEEVDALMALLKISMIEERERIVNSNIQFAVIGRTAQLPDDVRAEIDENIRLGAKNSGTRLCVALNYGSRGEITDAVREIVRKSLECGLFPDQVDELIDEEYFTAHLDTAGMPDPDLLIRTAGEMRLSNFLLWQLSYAEMWWTKTLWPDFTRATLDEAIQDFQNRERRFGGL